MSDYTKATPLTNESRKPVLTRQTFDIQHQATIDPDWSEVQMRVDFATFLQLMNPIGSRNETIFGVWSDGEVFIQTGVVADLRTYRVHRKTSAEIASRQGKKVYMRPNGFVIGDDFSGKLVADLEGFSFLSNGKVDIQSVEYRGTDQQSSFPIYHDPSPSIGSAPVLRDTNQDVLTVPNYGARSILFDLVRRPFRIFDDGHTGNTLYVDGDARSLMWEGNAGDDYDWQTQNSFGNSDAFGGVLFPLHVDEVNNRLVHSVGMVPITGYLRLGTKVVEVAYSATAGSLPKFYSTGNMLSDYLAFISPTATDATIKMSANWQTFQAINGI